MCLFPLCSLFLGCFYNDPLLLSSCPDGSPCDLLFLFGSFHFVLCVAFVCGYCELYVSHSLFIAVYFKLVGI